MRTDEHVIRVSMSENPLSMPSGLTPVAAQPM